MRALPCTYNGVTYRSRLEGRWAKFFHELELYYQFEPEGFELLTVNGAIYYCPDFEVGVFPTPCFFEVKPKPPTPQEEEKARELAIQSRQEVYLFFGTPWENLLPDAERGLRFDRLGNITPGHVFTECSKCHVIGICYGGYTHELHCGHNTGKGYNTPRLQAAAAAAGQFSGWNPPGESR